MIGFILIDFKIYNTVKIEPSMLGSSQIKSLPGIQLSPQSTKLNLTSHHPTVYSRYVMDRPTGTNLNQEEK